MSREVKSDTFGGKISNLVTSKHGLLMLQAVVGQQDYSSRVDSGVCYHVHSVVELTNLKLRCGIAQQPVIVDGTGHDGCDLDTWIP